MTPLPDLLIVGHVTRDHLGGEVRLGGAASFAARVAVALGLETAMLTSAPPDDPVLDELRGLPRLRMHVVPSQAATTFALDYAGPRRRLRLLATARPLTADDVPAAFRAPTVYVAPVAAECRRALVESLRPAFLVVGLQGWLRQTGPDHLVQPALLPEAQDPPAGLRAAVFSEEDHPEAEALAAALAARGLIVALTRGARGATVLADGRRQDVPAAPADEVDPTGAGDVFGVVFTLALARGRLAAEAAEVAAEAAARAVEGPGLGRLATFDGARLR